MQLRQTGQATVRSSAASTCRRASGMLRRGGKSLRHLWGVGGGPQHRIAPDQAHQRQVAVQPRPRSGPGSRPTPTPACRLDETARSPSADGRGAVAAPALAGPAPRRSTISGRPAAPGGGARRSASPRGRDVPSNPRWTRDPTGQPLGGLPRLVEHGDRAPRRRGQRVDHGLGRMERRDLHRVGALPRPPAPRVRTARGLVPCLRGRPGRWPGGTGLQRRGRDLLGPPHPEDLADLDDVGLPTPFEPSQEGRGCRRSRNRRSPRRASRQPRGRDRATPRPARVWWRTRSSRAPAPSCDGRDRWPSAGAGRAGCRAASACGGRCSAR